MQNHIPERDYTLSIIRLVSTILIVTCHMMQYLDCFLAWWFNVGVQIFLCLSGYLYGKREFNGNDVAFFKKQFLKILIDYYIVIIPAIVCSLIFIPDRISIGIAAKALLTYATIPGGGHLWYIPYCLICYFLSPLFSRIIDDILEFKATAQIIFRSTVFVSFVIILSETFFKYFNSAWITCYLIGFFGGRLAREKKYYVLVQFIKKFICVLAFLMNTTQILVDYIFHYEFSGYISRIYPRCCNFAHTFLGVSLFILMRESLSFVFKNEYPQLIKRACMHTDKLSYDLYLVHSFIIVGPYSLMALTNNLFINIFVILMLTISSAALVNQISRILKKCFRLG